MRTIPRPFAILLALACLPLVAGCGKDGPTAPKEAAPEFLDVTVTLVRLVAVADGDGIEGEGDFEYSAEVFDGRPTTLTASGSTQLETGSELVLNKSRVIRVAKGDKRQIKVSFTATEWDQSIFGVVYPDTRMDHLTESRTHSETSASASFNDGERWITLGSGDLQFRLVYTIASAPV
jgi:hypothetical protein